MGGERVIENQSLIFGSCGLWSLGRDSLIMTSCKVGKCLNIKSSGKILTLPLDKKQF